MTDWAAYHQHECECACGEHYLTRWRVMPSYGRYIIVTEQKCPGCGQHDACKRAENDPPQFNIRDMPFPPPRRKAA